MGPTSETAPQYGGCGYSWNVGGWSGWSSTCSASATRTRAVSCRRSDGTTVSDGYCAGGKPATSEVSAQYGGCSYTPSYGSWSACTSGSQTRSVTCTRSDGVQVAASYCGTTPTQTQSCTPPSCIAGPRFRFRFGSGPEFTDNSGTSSVSWSSSYACINQWVSSPGELYAVARITNNGVTRDVRASLMQYNNIQHGQSYSASRTENIGGTNYTIQFTYQSDSDYWCTASIYLSPMPAQQCP
jgi:hypothetical protein